MSGRRRARTALLVAPVLLSLVGCGVLGDPVTDCDMTGAPAACEQNERFELAGADVVVDDVLTTTELGGGDHDVAKVEARITVEDEPSGELSARLHVVGPLTEEALVIDPDPAEITGGEQVVTWDFSGHGFAERIQLDYLIPDVFILLDDGDREVRIDVISVHYEWQDDDGA